MSFPRLYLMLSVPVFGMLAAGCGGSTDGPPRFSVSGQVRFDGQPVPTGFVKFTPDASEGNSGPGAGATIRDGWYETPTGKGIVGGPHIVEITGWDGVPVEESGETLQEGTELFPIQKTTFDFPSANSEKNFDVPFEAETEARSESEADSGDDAGLDSEEG